MIDREFNLPPETVTTGQLFMLLQGMNARLTAQSAQLERMSERIARQESATRAIVATWKAGGTALNFVKLVGGVVVVAAAAWAVLTGWLTGGEA